jgi:hypothetical protein
MHASPSLRCIPVLYSSKEELLVGSWTIPKLSQKETHNGPPDQELAARSTKRLSSSRLRGQLNLEIIYVSSTIQHILWLDQVVPVCR